MVVRNRRNERADSFTKRNPPCVSRRGGWRHRPVRAFVYRIPTGYLQKIGRKAHLLYTLSHMICKIANTISRPISVQSFTQPARLRADGPTSPRSTQGGWLTHDQLLQWVWGPEKTGHPWLVHLVRIEPILRAYLGSQATSGRLPHLPSVSAYYPVTTHQRLCVPTRHTTGIERPWCVDRLPSHISKMVVSTVCVGGQTWTVDGTVFEMWLGGLARPD